MSSFVRCAAAASSSIIRLCRGRYFRSGISSPSSCSLLWRRTISILSSENPNPNPNPNPNHQPNNPNFTKQEAPWLLLPGRYDEYRNLYDLTIRVDDDQETEYFGKKLNRELHLPDIQERFIIGSSEGFLISMSMIIAPLPFIQNTATIRAFNPLTGSHLIPITNLPDFLYYPDYFRKKDIQSLSNNPSFLHLYGTKLILSPTLDTIVIFSNPDCSHLPFFAPLPSSFSSSSSSSSSSIDWTELSGFKDLYEGIFHKGRLHATNYHGDLYRFENLKPSRLPFYMSENLEPSRLAACPMVRKNFLRNSLVESPDGDGLFLVYRSIDDDDTWNDPHPRHLMSVYKLRFNQKKKRCEWDQVKSIGDLAFFVGAKSSSLSLDVSDRHLFPSLKPNSVYFSDSWSVLEDVLDLKSPASNISQAGVYTLEHKTFHSINLYGCHPPYSWPPMWYTPTTPAMQD